VQAHALDADGLAFLHQAVNLLFGKAPRVRNSLVDLADFFQMSKVFRRGDNHLQKRVALCGGAHFRHLNAVGLLVQQLIVLHDLVPPGDFAIFAQREAKKGFRGCDLLHRN